MVISPPSLAGYADVTPRPDGGFWVVPYVLPIHVPAEALTLTVAEWLGVDPGE